MSVTITTNHGTYQPNDVVTTQGTCSDCDDLTVTVKGPDGTQIAPPPAVQCSEGNWSLKWTVPGCPDPPTDPKVTITASCGSDVDMDTATIDCP